MSRNLPRTAIGPLMDRWLTGRLARGEIAQSTGRQQRFHIDDFLAHVEAETPVGRIDTEDIEAWIGGMTELAASTRNTKVTTIRSFFAWATERETIERNPCIWVRRSKVPKKLPKRVPREQVEKVLEAAPFRERTMIILMLQLGLRRAEVADLRIEHWDRERGLLAVTGKGSKERSLTVTEEAERALTAWLSDGRTAGPMWPSSHRARTGLSQRTISMNITRVAQDLGLHITPHQYRHTMATDALQAGATLPAVSRALGHESLDTTSVYSSINDGEMREQLEGRSYFDR